MSKRILGIQFSEIRLDDDQTTPSGIEQVQLLRVGEFNHSLYGKFSITKETLKSLAENFQKKVRRVDLAVDYFHEADKVAAGWINNVELREDGTELWINVDWTKNGKQKIEEKELRYISADFDFSYVDSETNIKYGPTLLGAGLTNRPHVKDMQPIMLKELSPEQLEKLQILLDDENKEIAMDLESLKNAVTDLTDDDKAQLFSMLKDGMEQLEENLNEDTKLEEHNNNEEKIMNEELQKQLSEKDERIAELEAKIATQEKESKFNVMLSEGKVVEAQREAFINNDMESFISNAKELNLSEEGSGSNKEEKEMTVEQAEIKLSEEAEKISKETGVDFGEAMSVALDRNPELAKQFN